MSFHYFAYGSVLSLAHAREWCESHALDVTPFLEGARPARLDGWRLVFRVPSRFWQGLVADLVPDPASHVEGVVFTLDDAVRQAVLRKEGVATGLYRENILPVQVGAETLDASVFTAEPARVSEEGPGAARYVESLAEGARERGLSPAWIAFLAGRTKDGGRPPPPGIPLGIKR
jgi:cation transport regulator ChaC